MKGYNNISDIAKKGDYNISGKINITDAYLILKLISIDPEYNFFEQYVCDFNNDNKINVSDVYLILKYIANNV